MTRTTTLLLTFCIITTRLCAQVELTFDDISATGVQKNVYQLIGGFPTAPPSLGVDQTWDLMAGIWQPVGTMHFRSAVGTPYAATYPGANWVWEMTLTGPGTFYTYLQIDNSGMYVVASQVPIDTEFYTNTKKVLQFPLAYGNSFSDEYQIDGGPVNVNWTYSGAGSILTTLGTLANLALLDSDEEDIFWNKTPLYPVLTANNDGVRTFVDATVGIADVNGGRTVLAYPNPCTDLLMVDGLDAASWRITDMNGRMVDAGTFTVTGVQSIVLAPLEAGSYLFLSDASTGTRVVRFSKQ